MKKNFSINSVAKKIQISSAKQELNNTLNFLADVKCCDWAVGIVGNAKVQKSMILR